MKYFLPWIIGVLTMASSSFFLCGYIFHLPSIYTFPIGATPVALPSSILFFIIGLAITTMAHRDIVNRND